MAAFDSSAYSEGIYIHKEPPPTIKPFVPPHVKLEAPFARQGLADASASFANAIGNPYLLILISYLAGVAFLLFFVSKSALGGLSPKHVRQDVRLSVLSISAFLSLMVTWYLYVMPLS